MTKVNKVNLKPVGDKVLISRCDATDRTAGGIVLPDSAKEKPKRGKVLAVGPGRVLENGGRSPMSVSKNDEVYFSGYAGTEIKIDGQDLLLMSDSDILAIVAE